MAKLCLILGDQLSMSLASLQQVEKQKDIIILAEVAEEAGYVWHHRKKIAFLFSAMRHFAEDLQQQGYRVLYYSYGQHISLQAAVAATLQQHSVDSIVVVEAGEYRLQEVFKTWQTIFAVPVEILPDTRFICSQQEFAAWAADKKQLRMEFFYREMRKKTGLLMEGGKPVGGKWNFDSDNRKALPVAEKMFLPALPDFPADAITSAVQQLVEAEFPKHFGAIQPFRYAVTRVQAQQALTHFIQEALPAFGDYQDAMASDTPFLYHSFLAQYINCGLLDALEVCQAAEQAYYSGKAPLNAVEGFIRQIIGWREYVRGLYWLKMPQYKEMNFFAATRPLPDFYWNAKTEMQCLRQVITMTQQEAYSHHIQRLMITGNFALLAGLEVGAVCDWYLAVYADAYEWVELPNTLGMALFADGGIMASKPYAASGAYINRMSDFCQNCIYDVKKRVGAGACPFNFLYWDFLMRQEEKLKNNPRLGFAYKNLQRFSIEEKQQIQQQAADFLKSL